MDYYYTFMFIISAANIVVNIVVILLNLQIRAALKGSE